MITTEFYTLHEFPHIRIYHRYTLRSTNVKERLHVRDNSLLNELNGMLSTPVTLIRLSLNSGSHFAYTWNQMYSRLHQSF